MNKFESWIALHGRLPRAAYLWRLALLAVSCVAIGQLTATVFGEIGAAVSALVFLLLAASLTARRLHDISRPTGMMAVLLLPIVGPVWMVLLVLRAGVDGRNRYGDASVDAPWLFRCGHPALVTTVC